MAKSQVTYKTKEEFEKAFKDIYNSGKEDGFDDGLAMGLSFLYDILDKFESIDTNILTKAQYYSRQRHIEAFNKMLKTPKAKDKNENLKEILEESNKNKIL